MNECTIENYLSIFFNDQFKTYFFIFLVFLFVAGKIVASELRISNFQSTQQIESYWRKVSSFTSLRAWIKLDSLQMNDKRSNSRGRSNSRKRSKSVPKRRWIWFTRHIWVPAVHHNLYVYVLVFYVYMVDKGIQNYMIPKSKSNYMC